MAATNEHTITLRRDTDAMLIHGVTGRDLELVALPAGTVVEIEGRGAPTYAGAETVTVLVREGESRFRYRVLAARIGER